MMDDIILTIQSVTLSLEERSLVLIVGENNIYIASSTYDNLFESHACNSTSPYIVSCLLTSIWGYLASLETGGIFWQLFLDKISIRENFHIRHVTLDLSSLSCWFCVGSLELASDLFYFCNPLV